MLEFLVALFSAASFMPHGYCLAWRPDLVAMHVISDAVIATSYFSIPAGIFVFLRKRPDFPYRSVAWGFAVFIVFCGLTHVASMATLWFPYYGLQGMMKFATALVSILTACALWPLIPRVLSLPSPRALSEANGKLSLEIVERKQAEAELRKLSGAMENRLQELEATKAELLSVAEDNLAAQRQAEDANRSKTAFLRNVCHELRTPLNAILGFSEVLNDEIFGKLNNSRYKEYARHIHTSGQHLLELLTNIIDLDQIAENRRTIELEVVRLKDVSEDVLEMMQARLDAKKLTVSTTLPASHLVTADKLALKQVIINLVGNAEKYTPDGGEINIVSRECDGHVEYVVSDTGVGIAAEDIDKLGQVFVRGGAEMVRQSEGSGLGLALCRSLLAQMRGSISFESKLGSGTSVTIRLPISASEFESHADDSAQGQLVSVTS